MVNKRLCLMLLPQGELAPHWRTSPSEELRSADVSLLRPYRARSSASGIVRPASFYEAQTQTTAQADERRSLITPSGCLLCTAEWWLNQHESKTRPVSSWGFWLQSVHRLTKKKKKNKTWRSLEKELCVQPTSLKTCIFEESKTRLY